VGMTAGTVIRGNNVRETCRRAQIALAP
jgi:hypothetical protein